MKKLLYLFAIILLFAGCETDLKLTGEHKDITIVYGLLNQNDAEHVLRIQKAFLGEQDALVMSQFADSNYYDTTKITVKLVDSDDQEILFHPVVVENKEPGDFYYGQNEVLYKATANLSTDKVYNLVIEKADPAEATNATTALVQDFTISKPDVAPQAKINLLTSQSNYFNYPVQWKAAENGIRHRLTVRFYYREVNLTTLDTVHTYIDWVQAVDDASSAEGGESLQRQLNGEEFFRFLQSNIEVNTSVKRIIGKGIEKIGPTATDHLDFIVDVAGEDFYNYLELNKPSTGLVQEKPAFTNVTNGLGVFSARYSKTVPNKELNTASIEELKSGQYTTELNFVQEQ